jgi:hypothetical protein
VSALGALLRRLTRPPGPRAADPAKDELDARLAATAARLADVRRREIEYRRFRDEFRARRPPELGRE